LPPLDEGSGLQAYLAYAALNNPQLEAAFNRWKAALEMVPQMRTLPDPKFNYGYFIQSVETRVGPQEQRFGISQMFPWFGKLKLRGDAALKDASAAQQRYEAAKLALFDEVKQAYYELYYLGRAISVTAENVDLLGQFEKTARAKYESGTAQYGDVLKAQVELDKLGDRLRSLEDPRLPTVARLNAALNRPARAPLPLPAAISPGKAPPEVGKLLEALKASNPEPKDLEFQAEREAAKISLAKREYFPDLTLGLDYIEIGEARTMAPPTVSGGAMPGAPPMTMMMPLV
jgi:outer membrane protein TolC